MAFAFHIYLLFFATNFNLAFVILAFLFGAERSRKTFRTQRDYFVYTYTVLIEDLMDNNTGE